MYKIMKKEFNWEEFKNKKMVVNCKNEEEVNNFFKECELNEIEVRSYTREFSYETYHSDVCYRCEDNDLYYADRSFYNNNYGYDIADKYITGIQRSTLPVLRNIVSAFRQE